MARRIERCKRVSSNHGTCGVCRAPQSDETEHYLVPTGVAGNHNFNMHCAACTAAYVLANGSEQ